MIKWLCGNDGSTVRQSGWSGDRIMRLPVAFTALAASLLTLSVPALADGWRHDRQWGGYHDVRGPGGHAVDGYRAPVHGTRGDPRGDYARGYPQPGWPGGPDPRYDARYRDYDRRFDRCRGNSGVTGAVLGAVLGGVLGDQVAGRGNRTMGTVLGAGVGAVAGSAIERSGRDRRCR